ncbi:hypothetical protein KR222_003132 [Zaprionus bogoriensis]|nr:hypothetical protein KR222_003132 [Zaprionus bogoriensis]
MLKTRIFRLIRDTRLSVPILRGFHHEFSKPEPKQQQVKEPQSQSFVHNKYKVFRDEEASEIFDVEEVRYQERDQPMDDLHDPFQGLNLKRGVRGVFDVEDLVELLRKENVDDIFVCFVPEELKYVDHLVVCSARSYRHMLATAEFVRRMFKIKRHKGDLLPRIEGEKSHDWMAMDLGATRATRLKPRLLLICHSPAGNIALHIFSPKAREEYDLESLWAIGSEYDHESQKPQNPLGNIFIAQLPKPTA